MSGFKVRILPVKVWEDKKYNHGRIVGLTECAERQVTIADDEPIAHSAWAHEMAHVVQRCLGQGPYDKVEMDGHENWERDGITAAASAVEDGG